MAIPYNKTAVAKKPGGKIHTEREVTTDIGKSRAAFANQPNEEGWAYSDCKTGANREPARQCAAAVARYRYCEECGNTVFLRSDTDCCSECGAPPQSLSYIRCEEIAVPGYNTCVKHGGGHKLTPANRAAMIRGSTKTGSTFTQILYCPCLMFGDNCADKDLYYDDEGNCRCYKEKLLYDSITKHFVETYELDEVADAIILQRLAMTLIRTLRNEKWIAQRGEIVERVKTSPDGTIEQWFESNAAVTAIGKLDTQLLAWLKSLNVNKAAREAAQRATGLGDLARLLSDSTTPSNRIIDVDTDGD